MSDRSARVIGRVYSNMLSSLMKSSKCHCPLFRFGLRELEILICFEDAIAYALRTRIGEVIGNIFGLLIKSCKCHSRLFRPRELEI